MGDDFDLFPKREKLDPFSFGQKEKDPKEEEQPEDLVFGGKEEEAAENLPDLEVDKLLGEPPSPDREPEPPMAGPIPDEQSSIGIPPAEDYPATSEGGGPGKRKPSPFVLIGGALVLILLALWGALNYLHQNRRAVPIVKAPAANRVTVKVNEPPKTVQPKPASTVSIPAPAPVPPKPEVKNPANVTPSKPSSVAPAAKPAPVPVPHTVSAPAPAAKPASTPPQSTSASAVVVEENYSVQVGACILKSSVRDLDKKLAAVGYDPIHKKGSTRAMMHFLSVGPFASSTEARRVMSELKQAKIDASVTRVSGGDTVVNAGSYLLEGNARMVMSKVQKMGYRVRLTKRETRLPMTFVRVGNFQNRSDADSFSGELMEKGFEAIVVKLQ